MKFGSHSNTHPHVNNLSYEKNIEEIEKSNDKIEKITGNRTKLYRAPYGEYNNTVIKSAMAPFDPSEQDYKVASKAKSVKMQAQAIKDKNTGNKLDYKA